jgi:hypothetical protein
VTHTQNVQNTRKRKNNKSGFIGVSLHKATGTWRATYVLEKRQISLGYFQTKEEAAKARDKAVRSIEGAIFKLNK